MHELWMVWWRAAWIVGLLGSWILGLHHHRVHRGVVFKLGVHHIGWDVTMLRWLHLHRVRIGGNVLRIRVVHINVWRGWVLGGVNCVSRFFDFWGLKFLRKKKNGVKRYWLRFGWLFDQGTKMHFFIYQMKFLMIFIFKLAFFRNN